MEEMKELPDGSTFVVHRPMRIVDWNRAAAQLEAAARARKLGPAGGRDRAAGPAPQR